MQVHPSNPTVLQDRVEVGAGRREVLQHGTSQIFSYRGRGNSLCREAEDTKYYTLGCKGMYIATDHLPLVGIL